MIALFTYPVPVCYSYYIPTILCAYNLVPFFRHEKFIRRGILKFYQCTVHRTVLNFYNFFLISFCNF